MKNSKTTLLLSPFFLVGLFLLLLNDFYLKEEFHNFLTGKLSDFAGLFVFPFFFAAFFNKKSKAIYLLTFVGFIFWKSPFANYFIETFNSLMFFNINRIIDYTDLIALLILPLSYLYFQTCKGIEAEVSLNKLKYVSSYLVVIISILPSRQLLMSKKDAFIFQKPMN